MDSPQPELLERAAAILRAGQLLAFPTETVYGLGANALDSKAVERIFEAKGRPASNPIIVHVPDSGAARELTACWPDEAQHLAEKFWPGPLTLVLPKSPRIPVNVTAEGDTIGIRAPNHQIALSILRAAGCPIAAPSANRSTEVSPTNANHVLKSLGGRIPLIVDGGTCPGGIESTVLDLSSKPFRILRPGPITVTDLRNEIGPIQARCSESEDSIKRSPGQMPRHYAPRAMLELCRAEPDERVQDLLHRGHRVAWLSSLGSTCEDKRLLIVEMPATHGEYASRLYETLHRLDEEGVDVILVSLPDEGENWAAIRDRLTRAAAHESNAESRRL